MTNIFDTGKEITIHDNDKNDYSGKIYSKTDAFANLPFYAIICLTNSNFSEGDWQHEMVDIYKTSEVQQELINFQKSGRTTHILIIPKNPADIGRVDKVSALREKYLSDY